MKNIDIEYSGCENQYAFAKKHDIIIQTHGIRKSVHIIYPLFPLKHSELDNCSKIDKRKICLIGESKLLFRQLAGVRMKYYSILPYESLYKNRDRNRLCYTINEENFEDEADTTKKTDPSLNQLSDVQISCQIQRFKDRQTQTETQSRPVAVVRPFYLSEESSDNISEDYPDDLL